MRIEHGDAIGLEKRARDRIHFRIVRGTQHDALQPEVSDRLEQRGGGRGRALAGAALDALRNLAVVTRALEKARRSGTEHDDIHSRRSEIAALRFEVRHHPEDRLRRDLREMKPRHVQRDVRRQRAVELRFDGRIGRRDQQSDAARSPLRVQ
ncbi:hypothetical protein D3C83_05240 [compost metagenome]